MILQMLYKLIQTSIKKVSYYSYILKYKDKIGTIGNSIRGLRKELKTIIITLKENS
ncbi:hypothetical protein ACJDU8_03635 [Clostridium sp. WILCCON 0269]|uniref:Uncharacterized protein n=1 Tax=Candidatus Clostridium eludens TaxID=3381663 RepID=A0ABW8SF48_9CLOT